MSEFKFNCPVCGQHIASDSSASGAQIECPTCFQPIIVPQAPQATSKYILSATQYIKPKPASLLPPPPATAAVKRRTLVSELSLGLLVVCVISVAVYVLHTRNNRADLKSPPADLTNAVGGLNLQQAWRLNLDDVLSPTETAAGRVHGQDFTCERAFLRNGVLALRQGSARRPELVVNVYFPGRGTVELARKQFRIATNDSGATPHIVLRWKEGDLQVAQFFTNGYAMNLDFGRLADDQMPGRIYLCLPDVSKSFVAGSFIAEAKWPSANQ